MYNQYMDQLLKNNIYAHKKMKDSNSVKELLLSHMRLTYEYYQDMENQKNLDIIILNIIRDMTEKVKIEEITVYKVLDLFRAAIYYHDIGKLNPNFQRENMENEIAKGVRGSTEHSLISARIYLDSFKRQINEEYKSGKYSAKDARFLMFITFYFSYIISRHHSELTNLDNYLTKLSIVNLYHIYEIQFDEDENTGMFSVMNLKKFHEYFLIDEVLFYLLNELLYSCLVTSDFLATAEFMTEQKINIKREKKENLFEKYEESQIYQSILEYKKGHCSLSSMNKLRSDLYIEVEQEMLNHLNKDIYYLEAPTGSGKTNIAINLSKILYQNNKEITSINYIFPFNTLIEQTKGTLSQYFKEYEDFIVINSCTPLVDEKEDILNYELAYIKSEFRQYDVKLTSHVNLFDILFGTSKSGKYNLYDLCNSVVVLDEIQAYSNKIWREMIILLEKLCKYFHIKLIIMSATLPKLDYLLDEKDNINICSLVQNKKKYFENKLFRERIKMDFSLLESKDIFENLKQKIVQYQGKKILVEFITKKSASLFYNELKRENFQEVYELTGDDNTYNRERIIQRTKEENGLILISTQTIEAGVDIDMDIGFKDISFLDSEEQFLGRINRSAKKENCIAYFFDLDDETKIYRNDYRGEYTVRKKDIRNILKSKDFESYYLLVMKKVYQNTEKFNNKNINLLYEYCKDLNFIMLSEKLKLIDNRTCQIFLNYSIMIDGREIKGSDIWSEYKLLYQDNEISYAKKQIELSKIKSKFNLFVFQVYQNSNKCTCFFDEAFGNIYYIENGEQFIQEGKFNREKYIKFTGCIFL